MMAAHRDTWAGGGAQNIAPTVYDKRPIMDQSLPKVMAIFWASDVAIQFGRGSGRFYRPADKEDIAKLFLTLVARFQTDEFPSFGRWVTKHFGTICVQARSSHIITLQWWWVRMLRELATIPNMMDATNRFPVKDFDVTPHISNLRRAGFGKCAKAQSDSAKRHPKPVTLPVPPANTEGEEDAA